MAKKRKNKKNEAARAAKNAPVSINRQVKSSASASTVETKENQTGSNIKEKAIIAAGKKEKQIISSALAQQSTQNRPKVSVSVPGFLAGIFLALVLGIYIGTLLPEILPKNNASHTPVPTPQATAENRNLSASSPAPETLAKNLPPELARRERDIAAELSRNPSQEKLWTELGDIYFDANMPRQSIDAYSHSLALNPANPDVLTDMGVMYRELGNSEKALECFRSAYAINPDHTQSRYNEGLVLANDLHKNEEAKKVWNELIKISPDAISPHGQTVRQLIEELK